ncbi:TRAM domain-containing protein [Candidatus Woesearchaeota archaeon]|nr:TRAM domain-containing protein [Candidatus Woesearchaeota archaeon]
MGYERDEGNEYKGNRAWNPRERNFRSAKPVPVSEGEELDVEIEGIAAKGDGVAKKEGFVIFVPGTKVGDKVHVRINKVFRKVAMAESLGKTGSVPAKESEEEASEELSEDDSGEEDEGPDTESDEDTEDTTDFGEDR